MANDATITLRTKADTTGFQQTARSADQLVNQLRAAAIAAGQSETKFLELAGALSLQALKAGDAAKADAILANANKGLAASAEQAKNAQFNLTDAQRASSQSTSSLSQELGGLKSALGAVGIGVGVKQVIDFGIAAGNAAISLRETENALHAVAGDQQTYNAIIAEAKSQQLLFGGTLQENIEGLSGLAITSRNTGAQLSTLVDLQRRLTVLNPAQGAQGGLIALNEALAGNISSLSRRFNIPRAALQELNNTTIPVAERLKVLDGFLNNVGITSEAVAGKVDKSALAFRRLGAAADDAKTRVGGALADAGAPIASSGAGILNSTSQFFSGNFKEAAAAAKDGIRGFVEGMERGNPVARAFGQAVETLTGVTRQSVDAQKNAAGAFDEDRIAIGETQIAMQKQAQQLAQNGGAFNAYAQAANAAGIVTQDAAVKIQFFAQVADASAQKSTLDAAAKDAQQAATAKVAFDTNAAADAFIKLNPNLDASQGFAAAAAAGLGPLVAQVIALRIEADKTRAALLGEKLDAQTPRQLIGADSDRAEIEAGKHAGIVAGRAKGIAQAAATAEAERQAAAAAGNVAPALAHAQAELNQLTKDGKQNTVEYINKQQEVNALLQKQAAQGKKTLDDQIAYAKATGDTATARKLLNQELASAKATGNLGEQARIIDEINSLDKKGKGPKGLSATDRADVNLTNDLNEQLKILLEKQSKLKEGSLAWKQVQGQILDIQQKIADEQERARNAALDARIEAIENRKKDREDARRLAAAQAVLTNPNAFSEEQRVNAADLVELLPLEQEKRNRSAAAKAREGGIDLGVAVATATAPSAPGAAQAPAGTAPQAPGPASQGGTPLILQMDSKNVGSILLPFIIQGLQSSVQQVRAAGG